MKRVLIIAAFATVAACKNGPPQSSTDQNLLPADPAVSQMCEIVPDAPPRDTADMGQLLTFGDAMVALYGECALRDQAKYDWIKAQGH